MIAAAVAGGYVALATLDGGFEPIVFSAVAILLWAAVAAAAVFGLWPAGGLGRPALAVAAVLVAFALWAFASMSWAADDGRAFAEGVRASGYAGLFVLAALLARSGGARAMLAGLAAGLVAVAALGVLARVSPGLIGTEPDTERLAYPIGYWNGLGAAMAAAVCLLAWLAIERRGRTPRALAIAPLAALPLPLVALAMTGSRGGFLAMLAGLTVLGLALARRPRIVAAGAGAVLALGLTIAVLTGGDGGNGAATPELGSAEAGEHLTGGGTTGRVEYWESALDAFASQPLHGIGAGEFEPWWTQHGTLDVPVRNAHSLFIESLAELGPLGLGLALAFFAIPAALGMRAAAATRRRGRGAAGYAFPGAALALLTTAAVAAAVDWTWELPAVFGIATIAATTLTAPAGSSGEPGPSGGRRVWAQRIAAIVAAAAAIFAAGALYLGELRLSESRAAAAAGDLEAAAERARDASDALPFSADPYVQLALVERSLGRFDAAAEAIADAIERAPNDWRLWLLSSRIAFQRDEPPGVVQSDLFRARELAPRAPHQLFIPGARLGGGLP